MEEGFLKLYRSLFKHPFWKEKRVFSKAEAWIDLLASARYSSEPAREIIGGRWIEWGRGEVVASVRYLSERWSWSSTGKVTRFLNMLELEGMIDTRTDQGQTIILIVSYTKFNAIDGEEIDFQDKYEMKSKQSIIDTDMKEKQNNQLTDNQSLNTGSQDSNGTPTGQQQNSGGTDLERQQDKTKKVNNGNKEKNSKKGKETGGTTFDHTQHEFWKNEDFQRAFIDRKKMRVSIKKPWNEYSIQLDFGKMDRTSKGDVQYAIDMMDQSTYKNWQGIFEVKPWFYELKREKNAGANYGAGFQVNDTSN